MPEYVVDLVSDVLNDDEKAVRNARILVVGVAYKENIDDTRQSPAIAVIDRLRVRGAHISYHDPHVPVLDFDFHDWPEWRARGTVPVERRALRLAAGGTSCSRRRYDRLSSVDLNPVTLARADCVVILTRHAGVDYESIARNARAIVDTRGAIPQNVEGSKAKVIRL
jgi:UDP-N-acetyl-D-glucosamine dehydrogenase